ncbi:MAG TPA: alpha/beta fold hydrolase [Cellvibrio sp.]|nr:alpha/beta fold hydrolase [Cellvibrio sp.]
MRLIQGSVIVILLVLCAALIGYSYPRTDAIEKPIAKKDYQFIKTACWFDADWTATITCGQLHTPDQFSLPVVILHNDAEQQPADPIVYLQGGPGASARLHDDGIKSWLNWMRYSNTQRDLILIDTRGTGRSKPALVCSDYNQFNQQLLRQNISLSDELAKGYEVATQCFASSVLANPELDYRNFSTQKSAQDIRALMAQLNYPEWNILGVSYGTRLALEIALQEQQAPQSVKLKSMILDSVYPAGFGGVQTWPQVLDEGMQQFFKGCSSQPTCFEQLNLSADSLQHYFMQTLHSLQTEPMALTIRRWDGEAPVNFVVNDHRFLSATFAAVYNPDDWLKIIDAMKAVHERRADLLKPLIEPFINNSMTSDFNSLTFTAVDCADNPVLAEKDYVAALKKYPLLEDYTRDQWRYQLCHYLPSASPLVQAAPQLPTLMLAGALDPITPVSWAKTVNQQWPQSQLRVREKLAHSVLSSDVCLLEHLDTFFDQPREKFTACAEAEPN